MRARVVEALSDIPAGQWDALHDGRNPFVTHAFLQGLEQHRCLRPQYGWAPRHVTLWGQHFEVISPRGRGLAAEWLAAQLSDLSAYRDAEAEQITP